MKFSALLFMLILGAATGWGQSSENGLIFDADGYAATPMADSLLTRGDCETPLRLFLRKYCPTPGDQGDLPSCVAWSLANALTIQKAIRSEETERRRIDLAAHSVSYIYNQIKYGGQCDQGAMFKHGLRLLQDKGDCLAESFGYSAEDCHYLPADHHHEQASDFRIRGYRRLFNQHDRPEVKIDAILCALARRQPVLIGMYVPLNFREHIPRRASEWRPETGHAMVIVGYNDLTERFEVMNSYGEDWGDRGFVEIDFETMGKRVLYGFILDLGARFGF